MKQHQQPENGTVTEVKEIPKECKVYKIRWLVLAIFVMYSASSSLQWIQFSIIADVVTEFYGVEYVAVNWMSQLYMVLYIPFIFPASYFLDKLGLRAAVLIGMAGTCLGTWIKVASVSPDRFWVAFLGQSVVALSQIFILSIPARLAAVWFGQEQVSSACSIGVFGNQFGIAMGFLLPPMIVKGGLQEEVETQLYIMFIAIACVTTVILILVLLFFKDAPPSPPSIAQSLAQNDDQKVSFLESLKKLVGNVPYMLLLTSYGINTGIFYAISTLLNQVILTHYPDGAEDAGRIGLVIVLAGMVGSVISGVALDKFQRYKETTLVVYTCSFLGMIVYTFSLSSGIAVVYVVSALLGFFMTGLLPVGFELAAELTYPEPEGTTAGLLNASSQLFGIIFTNIYSVLFESFNDTWANGGMSIMLAVGTVITTLIRSDLRRQAAQANGIS